MIRIMDPRRLTTAGFDRDLRVCVCVCVFCRAKDRSSRPQIQNICAATHG